MRWQGGRRSSNIEDRRGSRAGPRLLGGGVGTIVLVLVAMYFGVDPTPLLEGMQGGGAASTGSRPAAEDLRNDPLAAMGPFYCPADRKAYIDLSFYDQMRTRFKAPGDFAQAYVIAHEIGHHVQNLLGISGQVHTMKQGLGTADANALSVRLELQADCLAGVWALRADKARNILEAGDIDEALNAASAIGDDTLQRQSQGTIVPESFTHGTSAQRQRWFREGLGSGDPNSCDTFSADRI